jgi:hypothetical protein
LSKIIPSAENMQLTFLATSVRFVPPETPARLGRASWAEISEQRSHAAKVSHRRRRASLGKSSAPIPQRKLGFPHPDVSKATASRLSNAVQRQLLQYRCQSLPGLHNENDAQRKTQPYHVPCPVRLNLLDPECSGDATQADTHRFGVRSDKLLSFG